MDPKTELGKRLAALLSWEVTRTDWDKVAEAFANEVRGEAIPWAHKALDEVGAAKGPDIAGRIRGLHERTINVVGPAHKALDELGAPPSLDMAKRIRAFADAPRTAVQVDVTHAHGDMTWAGVPQAGTLGERVRWLINERARLLGAERNAVRKTGLTEDALNACKAFDAPTDPSDAVAYLAGLLNDSQAVRDELRAIIVEAIKGAR